MVSIILCTYNRAPLLQRAIDSVLQQTEQDWELVVVDDGSSDGTRSLVRKAQLHDGRIRYFFQTNKGLAGARNTGLKHAAGEYICFLDSDDEFAPEHLRKRLRYLKRNPSVDFLHGGMKLIGPARKRYVVDVTDRTKKIHLRHCHVGGTFFFRRTVLTKVKRFNALPFGEDVDFFMRVDSYFTADKVRYATYLYHLDSDNRLCDIFTHKLFKPKNGRSAYSANSAR